MFGLVWLGLAGGSLLKDGLKGRFIDEDNRQDAIESYNKGDNIERVYVDWKGRFRDIDTDQLRMYYSDPWTGELWLCDVNCNKLKNLTELSRKEKLKQAQGTINYFHTVIPYHLTKIEEETVKAIGFGGLYYQDIETGRIFVERKFTKTEDEEIKSMLKKDKWPWYIKELKNHFSDVYFVFYMDIETGLLVRLSDRYKKSSEEWKRKYKKDTYNEKDVDLFMRIINMYQSESKETVDFSDEDDVYRFYLNEYR